VIGTALVLLFAALALSGALARASMARSHRDGTGFTLWSVTAVVIVLLATSTIVFRDTWADLYDKATSFMSSK